MQNNMLEKPSQVTGAKQTADMGVLMPDSAAAPEGPHLLEELRWHGHGLLLFQVGCPAPGLLSFGRQTWKASEIKMTESPSLKHSQMCTVNAHFPNCSRGLALLFLPQLVLSLLPWLLFQGNGRHTVNCSVICSDEGRRKTQENSEQRKETQ